MDIIFDTTMSIHFTGGKETFVYGHPTLSQLAQMLCCPACCAYVPYTSGGHEILYQMEQLWSSCGCTWSSNYNGKKVGELAPPGMCDNGCFFCFCGCLTCDGHIKVMGLNDGGGAERLILARQLFPCWSCILPCCSALGLFSGLCRPVQGCCMYCKGREVQTISAPVFKGPWSRTTSETDPIRVGYVNVSYRYYPTSFCTATPSLLKTTFSAAEGTRLSEEEMIAITLIMQLFGNLETPCKLCCSTSNMIQMPTGISCLDIGMMAKYEWTSVTDAMSRDL